MTLKTKLSNFVNILVGYIYENKLLSFVFFYMIISLIINMVFSIDIMIPCLWKTIFDFDCPACGLTRSTIKLINFDFYGAYKQNPLVYLVIPAMLFYLIKDFKQYTQKHKQQLPQ